MLINLSNHPFDEWDELHKSSALAKYGSVEDLLFPEIDPNAETDEITRLADHYVSIYLKRFNNIIGIENVVHISGEPCFLFHFVTLAKLKGITCICSTTRRLVTNKGNIKTTIFQFVQFRKY